MENRPKLERKIARLNFLCALRFLDGATLTFCGGNFCAKGKYETSNSIVIYKSGIAETSSASNRASKLRSLSKFPWLNFLKIFRYKYESVGAAPRVYFLSHFHADHYAGLTRHFNEGKIGMFFILYNDFIK